MGGHDVPGRFSNGIDRVGGRTVMDVADIMALTIGPDDERAATTSWWSFEVLGRKFYCYNFRWRRQALAHHDLHHVLTGYPCTLAGEMQVATWEFAAGRYPNIFANLFCLPLVVLGCSIIPAKVWAAFRLGRRSSSVFTVPITHDLMRSTLADFQAGYLAQRRPAPVWKDAALFGALMALSGLLVLSPAISLWLLWVLWPA